MGYTHYWYRPERFKKETFKKFAKDCQKIFEYVESELGIELANGLSEHDTKPEANEKVVSFNGSDYQTPGVWTTSDEVTIPWPSSTAGLTDIIEDPAGKKTAGNWFAGTVLQQRTAPLDNLTGKGLGGYEACIIEQTLPKDDFNFKKNGLFFQFTKTAYRPYDLAVTAVLISLKHYFPKVKVTSDGEDKDWLDGKFLCNNLLGYGLNFNVDRN